MADVFLNYVAEDREKGEALSDALESRGFSIFRRDHTMGFGPKLNVHVKQQQLSAACTVALWSPAAAGHLGFLAVVDEAHSRNRLVSVSVEPVIIPASFGRSSVDLIGWEREPAHAAFVELVSRINDLKSRLADAPPSSSDLRAASPESRLPIRRRSVFLCYRREDTQDAAGRLYDSLAAAYGAERVFMDIDSVPLGIDFVEHVTEQIGQCNTVIVMIGKRWRTITDKKRRRRLDNEDDLLRAEVRAALQQKIPVIPVTVQNAPMPHPDDLPDDIRPLARRNGIDLSATRWKTDVERLIKELDRVMKG